MSFSPLIDQLIEALRCLPGVGPKSAQRMAFHLLARDRDNANHLSKMLEKSMDEIQYCQQCRTFCESEFCRICNDKRRDPSLLCIVESPIDMLAVEQTSTFRGYYFVLHGRLSPLDGIGPEEIGISLLAERLSDASLQEIILATNPTVEGQATAYYIAEMVKAKGLKATRIAHGVPIGGELEFIDGSTLSHALTSRALMEE